MRITIGQLRNIIRETIRESAQGDASMRPVEPPLTREDIYLGMQLYFKWGVRGDTQYVPVTVTEVSEYDEEWQISRTGTGTSTEGRVLTLQVNSDWKGYSGGTQMRPGHFWSERFDPKTIITPRQYMLETWDVPEVGKQMKVVKAVRGRNPVAAGFEGTVAVVRPDVVLLKPDAEWQDRNAQGVWVKRGPHLEARVRPQPQNLEERLAFLCNLAAEQGTTGTSEATMTADTIARTAFEFITLLAGATAIIAGGTLAFLCW